MSCHPLMPRGPGGLSACALVLPALQTTSIPKGQVQSISTESSQLLLLSTVRPPWFAMHSATKHMTLQATAHTGYRLQPTQATGYSLHRLQATVHTGYRLQSVEFQRVKHSSMTKTITAIHWRGKLTIPFPRVPCLSIGVCEWGSLPIVLEKEMTTHSSILAWEIPWTEEPGGLQTMMSQRVGQD